MYWIDYLLAFLKQKTNSLPCSFSSNTLCSHGTILIRCWNADMQFRVITNGLGIIYTIVFFYDVNSPFGCLLLGNLQTAIDSLRKGVYVEGEEEAMEALFEQEVIPSTWSQFRYCIKSADVHVNWLFEFIDAFWYFAHVSVIRLD
jgi:hypothetical protein